MAKPELGTKRVCVSCGTRFYDLTKVPAVCPKCGTEQPIEQPRPRRTGGNVVEERRPKKPVPHRVWRRLTSKSRASRRKARRP